MIKYSFALGCTIALCLTATRATANTTKAVEAVARQITVEIRLQQNNTIGSGVIVDRIATPGGNIYTLVTNRHVVCGQGLCTSLPSNETYTLKLPDNQQYQVKAQAVKFLGRDLDLAVIQFRSPKQYAVATLANENDLQVGQDVYTAGFPFEKPVFSMGLGQAVAVVNRRLNGDRGGYTVIYDAHTLPGMSGGGVFDTKGRLVAIHGVGEKLKANTDVTNNSRAGNKLGYNRGIPVKWLAQWLRSSSSQPVNVGAESSPASTADEFFISGFNRFVEPGDDITGGKKAAIADFSQAVQLNSNYTIAYFFRGLVRSQVREFRQSVADYDRTIALDPKFAAAYLNRATIKYRELKDLQGALADFDRVIAIKPAFSEAYNNRGNLRDQMNDVQGALADYNRVLEITPQDAIAYVNRGILKYEKLRDRSGALADFNQAIAINPRLDQAYYNRGFLKDNDVPGALADYNQAISLNPRYAPPYVNRGMLKWKSLNDPNGAVADFSLAIALEPEDAQAHINRGVVKFVTLKDTPGSIIDLRQGIKLLRAQGKTADADRISKILRQMGGAE
jgi:tetratricopeptide (TPR) repeat protein